MEECPEARYSQDGRLFNACGEPVGNKPADAAKVAEAEGTEKAAADSVDADLAAMSDDELRAYAKDVFGHEFHHRTSAGKMRAFIADKMRAA